MSSDILMVELDNVFPLDQVAPAHGAAVQPNPYIARFLLIDMGITRRRTITMIEIPFKKEKVCRAKRLQHEVVGMIPGLITGATPGFVAPINYDQVLGSQILGPFYLIRATTCCEQFHWDGVRFMVT